MKADGDFMALPMTHLIAAYQWSELHPELRTSPEFFLGTIAPDAIHVRDGNDKSRKNEVHYDNWRRPNEIAVIEFWRRRSTPFDIGYGIHVLLDGYWASSFRRDFPQILREDGRPIPELYYRDAYGVDRILYETSPLREWLFEQLSQATAPEGEFLTSTEFLQWREDTFEFYKNPKREFETPQYITVAYTNHFLGSCNTIFSKVYDSYRVDC